MLDIFANSGSMQFSWINCAMLFGICFNVYRMLFNLTSSNFHAICNDMLAFKEVPNTASLSLTKGTSTAAGNAHCCYDICGVMLCDIFQCNSLSLHSDVVFLIINQCHVSIQKKQD